MARFLEHGVDVVTFAVEPLVYPAAAPAEERDLTDTACWKGESRFLAPGMEPGWASLAPSLNRVKPSTPPWR